MRNEMTPIEHGNAKDERREGQSSDDTNDNGVLTMKSLEAAVGKATLERRGEESSSSSGGQGGNGSGSGGYSADYSSSEDCSSDASKGSGMKADKETKPALNVNDTSAFTEDGIQRSESPPKVQTGGDLSIYSTNTNADNSNYNGGYILPAMGTTVQSSLQAMQLNGEPMMKTGVHVLPTFQGPPPQWNGVRIQHPMDPRIDLSYVQHLTTPDSQEPSAIATSQEGLTRAADPPMNDIQPTVDHYLHLLEAVRPFFSYCGPSLPEAVDDSQKHGSSGSDGTQNVSSEGFTSFFTTTNSNTTSSDDALKSPAAGAQTISTEVSSSMLFAPACTTTPSSPQASGEDASADESDSSSMVVLARVKRKHLKKRACGEKNLDAVASETSLGVEQHQQREQIRGESDSTVQEGHVEVRQAACAIKQVTEEDLQLPELQPKLSSQTHPQQQQKTPEDKEIRQHVISLPHHQEQEGQKQQIKEQIWDQQESKAKEEKTPQYEQPMQEKKFQQPSAAKDVFTAPAKPAVLFSAPLLAVGAAIEQHDCPRKKTQMRLSDHSSLLQQRQPPMQSLPQQQQPKKDQQLQLQQEEQQSHAQQSEREPDATAIAEGGAGPRESPSSSGTANPCQGENGQPQEVEPPHIQGDNDAGGGGLHRYSMQPRVVSESSERNGSSSASRTMTTTTSGSGSGGDSGTKSGSANGSSGSGNEGKGSSTDNAKGDNDNSGADLNSDEGNNGNDEHCHLNPDTSQSNGALHHHAPSLPDTPASESPVSPIKPQIHAQDILQNEGKEAVRERLLDKKRKRMNMRREYEEQVQQQMESSESSSSGEVFLRPGKPVTLDEVLGFTKTPRIVVQGTPPFLVVYANAAFSGLTGIDSHSAIGKPIASMLSIPEPTAKVQQSAASANHVGAASTGEGLGSEGNSMSGISTATPSSGQNSPPSNRANNEVAVAHANDDDRTAGTQGEHVNIPVAAAGHARATFVMNDPQEMCLERLVAASGFGRYHIISAVAKNQQMAGRTVTVVHENAPNNGRFGLGVNRDDQESRGSSVPSVAQFCSVLCRMGVSPVVSSPQAMDYAVVTDNQEPMHHHHGGINHFKKHHSSSVSNEKPSSKRRKHGHVAGHGTDQDGNCELLSSRLHHRRMLALKDAKQRNVQRNTITHFVIQLDSIEGSKRSVGVGGGGSLSSASTSTTVEARIYGVPKAELKRRRVALNGGSPAPAVGAASSENSMSVATSQIGSQGGAGLAEEEEIEVGSHSTPPVSACG